MTHEHRFRKHSLDVCKECSTAYVDGIYSPTITKLFGGNTKEAESHD